MTIAQEIPLGAQVEDIVSGLRGIVTAKHMYLNGCTQYTVEPKTAKTSDGKPEAWRIDDVQLKIVGKGLLPERPKAVKTKKAEPGGPTVREK